MGRGEPLDDQSKAWWWALTTWVYPITQVIIFWFGGVLTVGWNEQKISDFFSDYDEKYSGPPKDRWNFKDPNGRAPLMVSNHIGHLDMMIYFLLEEVPSFVANAAIRTVPMIGNNCTIIQSIYFSRAAEAEKNYVTEYIKTRINQVEVQKTNHPTMMVFAEGTTNNGEWIMEFKKGAFIDHRPIKIHALTFDSKVNPCWNLINAVPNVILLWANPGMGVTIHSFQENFNPQYSLDKRGITGNSDPETTWQYVADDVYYLMEYGFGIGRSHNTFRDKVEFKKNLNIKVL